MRKGKIFSAVLCALLLCGCWGRRDLQTVYDWRTPAPRSDLLLQCGVFRNFSSADLALRYQHPDGTVAVDPYRRWAQAPELLLRSYLMTAFSAPKANAPTVRVGCTIFEFRADTGKGVCSLGVEYTLKIGNETRDRIFRAEKPFNIKDPASIGEAFSAAAADLVQAIAAAAK